MRICHHHASLYDAQRSKRCCAKDDCHHAGRHSRDGIRLCTHHTQPRGVRWKERSQTPPRSRRSTADEDILQQSPAQLVWVAYIRDPEAPAAAGMEAYYRYEAVLGDEATIGNGEFVGRKVRVPEVGLSFAVPLGCFKEPERGVAEFWATMPPVVCRRQLEPIRPWVSTSTAGKEMSARTIVALARQQDLQAPRHTMGNPENGGDESSRPPWTPRMRVESPSWQRPSSPSPSPWAQTTGDFLASMASKETSRLDDYLRLRAEGYSDAGIIE